MAKNIGIDLGTTNSVVAFIDGTKVEIISNAEGSRTTPSIVYYKNEEELVVGEIAKRQYHADSKNVVKSVKRIMGKRFEEISEEEQEDLPFRVISLPDDMAAVELEGGIVMRPEDVSADILDVMKEIAENFLDEEVYDAVITVPAHFNDQQRTATKVAAKSAGLNVIRIINEPTAAALAFGLNGDKDGTHVIFDFGGGTFDVSILMIKGDIFEVLSTNGDNQLGGDDIDHAVFNEICDRILEKRKIDPTQDSGAVQRIKEAAEKVKIDLSTMEKSTISLPFIVADSSGPKHYEADFSRNDFNKLIDPILQRLFEPCKRALQDAELTIEDIDEVILVGGSTRIPRVQEMVETFFQKKPNTSVNPDEAVAAGAAVQSGVISGDLKEILLLDVTPLTLGIELAGGEFKPMIERNSTIPCEAEHKFTTVVNNQRNILVRVLQGERRVARENHFLAEFRLMGIPPAPKEIPEIMVSFSIDANGILEVRATDMISGNQTNVIVENYGNIGVSEEEVKAALEQAEQKFDEDAAFIGFTESRARALAIQEKVNHLFDIAGEVFKEIDIKTLKESVFKLDLAMDDLDMVAVSSLCDTINNVLADYQNNEELDRALRMFDEDQKSQFDFDSQEEVNVTENRVFADEYESKSKFGDIDDIEKELKALMDDAEEIASAVESGKMMEQEIARKKLDQDDEREEKAASKRKPKDLSSKSGSEDGELSEDEYRSVRQQPEAVASEEDESVLEANDADISDKEEDEAELESGRIIQAKIKPTKSLKNIELDGPD